MRILVVGKGGREHALAKKLADSEKVSEVMVAPGNSGMQKDGISCVDIEATPEIVAFTKRTNISLVVLGPEVAILSDLKEKLEAVGIPCFAPSPAAARLESSKIFCKEILSAANLRTAAAQEVLDAQSAEKTIRKHHFSEPLVIKVNGLAQGKGVAVCDTLQGALKSATELGQNFGFPLLIEQCLQGPELSAFALCDGEEFVFLGTACDYKRITADPFSANTGGMGAYSPCDFITEQETEEIQSIFAKTLKVLSQRGTPYHGFLFAGLMKTPEGLQVLEFNVRMGDPETQALMPRLESDLAELIARAVKHELKGASVRFKPDVAVHVVMVSQGYPEKKMEIGHTIEFKQELPASTEMYFSGVSSQAGALINTGGRVLGVTGLAPNRAQARELAYAGIQSVEFKGRYFREDIAK